MLAAALLRDLEGSDGQPDSGTQAAHRGVLQRDGPLVEFGEITDNCESKSRTRRGFVSAHSALKHYLAHGRSESGSVVIDGHNDRAVLLH
jgi:hypothetical protein